MKRIFFVLLAIGLTGAACEKKELQDEQTIASNLSKKGKTDQTLLIGEWELVRFAYTPDGSKISNKATISNCTVNITKATKLHEGDDLLGHEFSIFFKICDLAYSKSGNMITFISGRTSCYQILVPYTDDETAVDNALRNAYSFVIRGKELIIHFTGAEGKNLLILKKNNINTIK